MSRPTVALAAALMALVLVGCAGSAASESAASESASSGVVPAVGPSSAPSPSPAVPQTTAPSETPGLLSTAPGESPGPLSVVREVDVPASGFVVFARGSVWAVARSFDELDRESTKPPPGAMYEIDEASGKILHKIGHAVGGFPAVGEGAIWLCTLWGQQLTRVDLETRAVERFRSSNMAEYEPEAVVTTPGAVWVGNNWAGEVAKVDARTLKVIDRIAVSDGTEIGPRGVAVSDGTSVWFPLSPSSEVVRIDARTDRQISRMDIGEGYLDALNLDGDTLYAGPPGRLVKIDVREPGKERVTAAAPISGILAIEHGFGSLWVLRSDVAPDADNTFSTAELLRVDPGSLAIQARLPLTDASGGVAVGDQGIWVRVNGKVLEVAPG